MTPQQQSDFIAGLVPGAQAAQAQYNVFASVTIAQAIFESSWGQSELTQKANNLFGIKASTAWNGATIDMSTNEDNGGAHMENAIFRSYPDQASSIADHAAFISNNRHPLRYAQAFACTDGPSQAMAIAEAGYSTNPLYGKMLCNEIHARNLTQYDVLPST